MKLFVIITFPVLPVLLVKCNPSQIRALHISTRPTPKHPNELEKTQKLAGRDHHVRDKLANPKKRETKPEVVQQSEQLLVFPKLLLMLTLLPTLFCTAMSYIVPSVKRSPLKATHTITLWNSFPSYISNTSTLLFVFLR